MSGAISGSNKSNLVWKITAVVFVILTIGASTLAYYYYGQNQNKISNAANANNYYSQWQADETKISSLNQQISSDQSQIQSLNNQISQL